MAFNIKRCGLFLGLLGSIAAAMAQNTARLRNGDLLFCCANMKTASSFSRSIVASTKGCGSNDINHVAIVCIERGATFIIEATGDKGVWMCPIDTFISRAPKADDGTPLLLHGRIKGDVDINTSVANAKSHIGLKYDNLFSDTDDEFYCSELVQKSFVDSNGSLIFEPIPMSFHDARGTILPYWTEYYAKRGLEVPEGKDGSNPAALSSHKRVKILGRIQKTIHNGNLRVEN